MNKSHVFLSLFLAVLMCASALCSCGIRRVDDKNSPGEERYSATAAASDESAEASTIADAVSDVAEQTEEANVDPNAPETRLSFLGCGDNIVYYGNVREAAASAYAGGREYNFAPTYQFVADMVRNADISFINQETLMCGEGYEFSYYPTFNGPQDMGLDLVDLGYDVVSIANNHMLDQWGSGLEATIAFWKTQPVLMIGGYMGEDDYTYRVLDKDGVKIPFLSYTYGGPSGTNGLKLGEGYEVIIPYIDDSTIETVKKQISAAHEDPEVDLVFVSVHWGLEGHFEPTEEQKNYANIMTEAGADVIIGHHPHVIEPVEWLTASDGTKTLCVYSLGNFIGEQAYDYNMVGGMISFDIVKKGAKSSIENPVFIPTVYYFDSNFYSNCVYPMTQFTEALAASHGIGYAYGNYTSLEKLQSYVTSTISPEFLSEEFKAQAGLK